MISSDERFKFLVPSFFHQSEGFIILINLSQIKTYNDTKSWISLIKDKYKQSPILLVAYYTNTKEVPNTLIQGLINEPYINYIEISLDNEMDVRSSIIFLACIIMELQIPYDIQQRINSTSYFRSLPYVKKYKEKRFLGFNWIVYFIFLWIGFFKIFGLKFI